MTALRVEDLAALYALHATGQVQGTAGPTSSRAGARDGVGGENTARTGRGRAPKGSSTASPVGVRRYHGEALLLKSQAYQLFGPVRKDPEGAREHHEDAADEETSPDEQAEGSEYDEEPPGDRSLPGGDRREGEYQHGEDDRRDRISVEDQRPAGKLAGENDSDHALDENESPSDEEKAENRSRSRRVREHAVKSRCHR